MRVMWYCSQSGHFLLCCKNYLKYEVFITAKGFFLSKRPQGIQKLHLH